jgi:putative transposase
MDRFQPFEAEYFPSMRANRLGAIELLLLAAVRERAEPAAASAIGRILHALAFYGSRRLLALLRRNVAFGLNRKRIQRLMDVLGLAAIYPKRQLSQPAPGHQIHPYLLRDVVIKSVNQVWSSDITYVRLQDGFAYLAAVIDWFSRFVLSWAISNTVDAWLCREVLDAALASNAQPEIFNTDQGSQFTSQLFLAPLKERHIRISMDGRGRALDNAYASYCTSCEPRTMFSIKRRRFSSLTPCALRGGSGPGSSYSQSSLSLTG